MSKAKKRTPVSAPVAGSPATASPKTAAAPKLDSTRETIEAIAIALILAFLFRTFEAEAFEIPTGSMGPTLMGRHKDVWCPQCGFRFQAGTSFEVDDYGYRLRYPTEWQRPNYLPELQKLGGQYIEAVNCTCPMCRYTMSVSPDNAEVTTPLSYKGDRIWVSKTPFDLRDPERWEVVVFKFPKGADENYIKRLVGLPGETLRVHCGNLYVSPLGKEEFEIARKPGKKVLATLQPVYDNDYLQPSLAERGMPPRWEPRGDAASPGAWKLADEGRALVTDGKSSELAWAGYQHRVPSWRQWQDSKRGALEPERVRPQLISDFCAYNTALPAVTPDRGQSQQGPELSALGLHWVGDLALDCVLDVEGDQGEVVLRLVEGGRLIDCRIDVATGEAQLGIEGLANFAPRAKTSLRGPGKRRVMFANVDDRLHLWIDGQAVEFTPAADYPELDNYRPTPEDLVPVRIGARGVSVTASHLRIFRDIYYIATQRPSQLSDFSHLLPISTPEQLAEFMSNPDKWDAFNDLAYVNFDLQVDEFLMLGDNSPKSGDSRYWVDSDYNGAVHRDLLIGKAFFVYWPHAWETHPSVPIPFFGREVYVPFYPNLRDMRRIH